MGVIRKTKASDAKNYKVIPQNPDINQTEKNDYQLPTNQWNKYNQTIIKLFKAS